MSTTIASLAVEIGSNITGLNQGLADAETGISGLSRRASASLGTIGTSITNVGTQMSLAFAPLSLAIGAGIKVAGTFESTLAEIQARGKLSADEMEKISDFSQQMGADTAFSANQAAQAFLELLSSGQSVEEAIKVLPDVLNAAAAGGMALGQSADLVTDIMAQFHLSAEESTFLIDSLAAAAGSSSADIASLGAGFANLKGFGDRLNIPIDQMAAALAILAENGIKGSEAGTNLSSMFKNMTATTASTQAAWVDLGTSMFDSEGKMRDLPTVLEEIGTALDGMTDEKRNQVMNDLWGSYGVAAGNALIGETSITDMQEAMEGSSSAAVVAEARMDTFEGRIESLTGSLETLAIEVLTPLIVDTLTPLADKMTEIVNAVTVWADENPALAGTLMRVALALAIAGPALFVVGNAIKAMSLLTGPIGLLVLGVGAIIALLSNEDVQAGLAAWQGMFENVEIIWGEIWDRIGTAWDEKVVQPITGLQETVGLALSEFGTWLDENIIAPITALADAIRPGLETFFGIISQIMGSVQGIIDGIAAGIANIKTQMDGLSGNIGAGVEGIGGTVDLLASGQVTLDDVVGAIGAELGLPPAAHGALTTAGQPLVVGERGPELFMPSGAGRIIPNNRLGSGGGGNTYHITVAGQSPQELMQMIALEARNADS